MHALIVLANPNKDSLTHAVAKKISDSISQSNKSNSSEIVDLAAENFNPCYTSHDALVLHGKAEPSEAILAEQTRIDRADTLILVHPVYWWSFPAILKGWIDRVFTNGWAYDDTSSDGLNKKLGHLPIHIFSIAGAGIGTYARHGYYGAMRTQINHGIFGYCGAPVQTSELMFQSNSEACIEIAGKIGKNIFSY